MKPRQAWSEAPVSHLKRVRRSSISYWMMRREAWEAEISNQDSLLPGIRLEHFPRNEMDSLLEVFPTIKETPGSINSINPSTNSHK
jgi:hypothetical protein